MTEIIDFASIKKKSTIGKEFTFLDGDAARTRDSFGYAAIMNEALHTVARKIIQKVAIEGLPGAHHLYIRFDTTTNGVILDDYLRSRYPAEMVIQLQHKFTDLDVTDTDFTVTLQFEGTPKKIVIPFMSIISVVDPSVPFGFGMIDPSNV